MPNPSDIDLDAKYNQLIVDSKKNEIKRAIGYALLNHLKCITIRQIIEKKVNKRSPWDNKLLIALLKKQECLRNFRKLKDSDFKLIANSLIYKEVKGVGT